MAKTIVAKIAQLGAKGRARLERWIAATASYLLVQYDTSFFGHD